jgi:hypothetical protein
MKPDIISRYRELCRKQLAEKRACLIEFKTSGVWKEEFPTWDEACRVGWALNPQRVNALIAGAELCDLVGIEQKRTYLKDFKASWAWKEQFLTWDEACRVGLGLSRHYVNRLIAQAKRRPEPPRAARIEP